MNPPLANDPVTHIPFPKPDWKWKMANYFLEKWGRKLTMKILQAAQPVITIIVGKIANTTESEQVISIAIGAAILGVIDMVISWVTGGKLQSLQKIQEAAEAEQYDDEPPTQSLAPGTTYYVPKGLINNKVFYDPQPTMTGIPPLGLGAALQIQDVVKRDESVVEIEVDGVTLPRKYFTDMQDASGKHISAFTRAENYVRDQSLAYDIARRTARSIIYQPGDVLP